MLALSNLLFLVLVLLLSSCDRVTEARIINDNPVQWLLPSSLHEASGLAVAGHQSVYIHNDEQGEIYQFNIRNGLMIKLASIGWPPVKDDFEGIAVTSQAIYLMTSNGQLFEIDDISADKPHQVVDARRIATGLKNHCEFEGLHHLDNKLLMPCKEALTEENSDRFTVFAFDIESETISEFLSLDISQIAGIKQMAATAFEATAGHYYIVTEDYLVRIDRSSLQGESFRLNNDLHRQVEGIALLPDGTIILVEDNRRGLARLTRYSSMDELASLNP